MSEDMDIVIKATRYLDCLQAEIKDVLGREVNDGDHMTVVSDRDENGERCGLIYLTYDEIDTLRALALKAINAREALS